MITKGIRGAITVDANSEEAIKNAACELFSEMVRQNNLTEEKVSHVIFTVTKDLNAAYPAKYIRKDLNWNKTAFMCVQEADIENSLPMCLRTLVVLNCEENFEPKYVYLKGAKNLRA